MMRKKADYDWENPINVEKESVGQFTGAYDIDGCEIYEGDVVTCFYDESDKEISYIVWDDKSASFQRFKNISIGRVPKRFDSQFSCNLKVIDNIYDNQKIFGGGIWC